MKNKALVKTDTLKISNDIWDKITNDMEKVISDEKGTGKGADPLNVNAKVFGKTGTAENPHGEDHAWFIGWMKYYEKDFYCCAFRKLRFRWCCCSANCKKYF